MTLLDRLGMDVPIHQAPMAGVSSPVLAAAVSNAGGLGSISVGATDATGARAMIETLQALTDRAFNVNLFVHADPKEDVEREAEWLNALKPAFERFGAQPPSTLNTIYRSFQSDDEMLQVLLETRPPVVSFHFGLPRQNKIDALKAAGCVLVATATCLPEAMEAQTAGLDVIVAQGIEAGGHRGIFDSTPIDSALSTFALTRLLVDRLSIPVIAAGGIMDGRGIASVLSLGAAAAQLGTAFVACPESLADAAYRTALMGDGAHHTQMISAISGRPARCLANAFTAWASTLEGHATPDYPRAYDAGKSLNQAAKKAGEFGFGAQWAGQGAPLARVLPAAELVLTLARELAEAKR
ncbi:MAG: nitronate monooxygenase [Henriciella sp.]|nr:nitronate monooxygenase [Henriciella sp.]